MIETGKKTVMSKSVKRLQPRTERVYVKVTSDFDATGYMQPRSVTWTDGKTYQIEKVQDYRPASTVRLSLPGDCYTVIIQGQTKHLYFERTDFPTRFGRWFVEVPEDFS
ncbi:MAG: hypothetical protein LUE14_10480 [Clostridiales bacterium]|nr:hypothetical protein [Clostridiales bacterium]